MFTKPVLPVKMYMFTSLIICLVYCKTENHLCRHKDLHGNHTDYFPKFVYDLSNLYRYPYMTPNDTENICWPYPTKTLSIV